MKKENKRENGNYGSWVFLLSFVSWNTIWISIWSLKGCQFDIGTASIIFMITLGLLWCVFASVKTSELIEVLTYEIYKFQVWDRDSSKYVTKYQYTKKSLMANYFLTFKLKYSIDMLTLDELRNQIPKYGAMEFGYDSKEAVMKDIIHEVKKSMSILKVETDQNVKNLEFVESINVKDLTKILTETQE